MIQLTTRDADAASWTNWSGLVVCTPSATEQPTAYAEVAESVLRAAREGRRIRVAGSGHSFSPLCATDGVLILLDGLQGVVETDSRILQARVHAGSKLHAIGEPLFRAGMALEQQGDINRQSLAGAISTGTHGTGAFRNMSNQAAALKLVIATGETIECSAEHNAEIFRAAKVALGALGVLVEVTLQCVAPYKLAERAWIVPFEEGMAQFDSLCAAHRHCEYFYTKQDDSCIMKTLSLTDADTESHPDRAEGERVGWSYQVFASDRDRKFNEMEYSMPAPHGPDCMREIREVIRRHDEVGWPVEYRTVKGDDIPLSPHFGRDSVAISVHQGIQHEHEPFFRDCEAVFRNHQGRPHWGKLQYMTHAEIGGLYPDWDAFQRIRDRLDPSRVFSNPYLDRVLG